MTLRKIELTNNFHKTSVNIYVLDSKISINGDIMKLQISAGQLKRISNQLCGWCGTSWRDKCKCGDIRGEQPQITIDSGRIFTFQDLITEEDYNGKILKAELTYYCEN